MLSPWSRVPALPLATGFAGGVLAVAATGWVWLWLAVAVTAATVLWWRGRLFAAAFAIAFAGGAALTHMRQPAEPPEAIVGRQCTLTGHIDKLERTPGTARCVISVDSVAVGTVKASKKASGPAAECRFRVMVTVFGSTFTGLPGDEVKIRGLLQSGHGKESVVPDKTDYQSFLYIDGVTAVMKVQTGDVRVTAHDQSWLQTLANAGNAFLHRAVAQMGCDGPTSAFLLATVAGDDMMMDIYTADTLRATGLAHVLALSGLHLGILVMLVNLVTLPLTMSRRARPFVYIAIALAVIAYALMTGLSASVARAAVVVAVYMLSAALQRRRQPFNALCVSVLVWLLINPWWIFSPGFQLSVVAVLSIVCLEGLFNPGGKDKPGLLSNLVALVVVPLAAFTGTSIVILAYFHTLPVYFLPANVVASLLVPLIIGGGAVGVLLTGIGVPTTWLAWCLDRLYGLLEGACGFFASLPNAQITGIYPAAWQIAVGVALTVALCIFAFKRRRVAAGVTLAALLAVIVTGACHRPDYDDELYLLDTHDCTTLLAHHKGECIVISDHPDKALDRVTSEYPDFAGRRGAVGFTAAGETMSCGPLRRRGPLVSWHGRKILMLTADSVPPVDGHIDYLVVGKGFTGNIVSTVKKIDCDTVVLAPSLNRRRLRSYATKLGEFTEQNIAWRTCFGGMRLF